MKVICATISLIIFCSLAYAQTVPENSKTEKDSATIALEKANTTVFTEQEPSFPGGESRFYAYLGKKLTTPELVSLFGYKGRLVVGFTVDARGKLVNVQTFSESGMGYEQELIEILNHSPFWKPGVQNGRPVDVKFTIPLTINLPKTEIDLDDLNKSSYKFSYQIKGISYDSKHVADVLGKKFSANRINRIKSFVEQPPENVKNKQYVIYIDTE